MHDGSLRRGYLVAEDDVPSLLVTVAMVQVGQMGMIVNQRGMLMPMAVWFTGGIVGRVFVVVVFVVMVGVLVLEFGVSVLVCMALAQQERDAK